MAPSKVSLKLLIDKKGQRVLFAEAGKDFVDFLFGLLALPIGTVIRLLDTKGMVGCLAKLYQSIKDLDNDYILSNQQKGVLLEPKFSLSSASPQVPLLPLKEWSSPPATLTDQRNCITPFSFGATPAPAHAPSFFAAMPAPAVDAKGFVKGVVTYMVMDDLVVTPMSTISSITLLNKFNIKEVDALEEKVVHIGMDQGLEILKNALASNTVLTNVFLGEVGRTNH